MADYELALSTPVIPSISANTLSIGIPSEVVSVIPAISISHAQGVVIHQSAFDVNVDYDLSADLSVIPAIDVNPVIVGIVSDASLSVIPSIHIDAFPYRVIHQSVFDVCAPINVDGLITVIPSSISCNHVNGVYGSISVIPSVADSVLGVGITAASASVSVVPAMEADIIKKPGIKFGTLKFVYAKRNSADVITPIIDDRFINTGTQIPRAYTRKISVIAATNDTNVYSDWMNLINQVRTLFIDDTPYDKAVLTSVSDKKLKPGLDRWEWTMEFVHHVYDQRDSVLLDGYAINNVVSLSDEQKQPLLDDRFTRSGITEPVAFNVTRTIEFVDTSSNIHQTLENKIGKSISVTINGTTKTDYKISDISTYQAQGGGNISVISVSLRRYQFNTSDTVRFNGLTLSNPILPNAMDITPTYSVDMNVNNAVTNGIPKITRRYAFECIATSTTEFDTLVSWIGIRGTLVINGKSHTLCHITTLSALQPIGGGNIWKYTIEFSRDSGISPAVVTFDGVSLPNAVISSESLELLQSRTTLHSGKIVADLGNTPSKQVSVSCMSNSKSVYNSLYAKLGQKKTLVVDGETITKAYISDLQSSRIIGEGATRLYTWDVSFEQETA